MLWRAIAISDRGGMSLEPQARIFKMWLTRSRNSPLSIQITAGFRGKLPPDVLGAVACHHARLEYLKLHLLSSRLPVIKARMPLLRQLDLACGTPITWALRKVPLLRTVILDDIVWPDECVPILKQAPNLVHCELGVLNLYDDSYQLHADISLPYLESLAFKEEDQPITGFHSNFLVAALRSLEVPERCLGVDPIVSLSSFVSRSRCTLREISITGKRLVSKNLYRNAFSSVMMSFSDDWNCVDEDDEEF
ncbi:hypothetical protein B0H19DRAFT_1248710 [Mycena capillaripes]|nr:hypothetical protein B0H19DRAFT_1248710 [Mycena capillaripes]